VAETGSSALLSRRTSPDSLAGSAKRNGPDSSSQGGTNYNTSKTHQTGAVPSGGRNPAGGPHASGMG
jgi:hypothetical protein